MNLNLVYQFLLFVFLNRKPIGEKSSGSATKLPNIPVNTLAILISFPWQQKFGNYLLPLCKKSGKWRVESGKTGRLKRDRFFTDIFFTQRAPRYTQRAQRCFLCPIVIYFISFAVEKSGEWKDRSC